MKHKRKIGVLGGAFNPVHFGHLELARAAHEEYGIETVMFMPVKNTYYKDNDELIDISHRASMIHYGIEEYNMNGCNLNVKYNEEDTDFMEISFLDINREGTTYTCDTVRELKEEYPDCELFFILGSDSLLYIDRWRNPEYILSNIVILTGRREGNSFNEIDKHIEMLKRNFDADIRYLNVKNYPISSSMIREIARQKNYSELRKMIPESVMEYIKDNNLYIK